MFSEPKVVIPQSATAAVAQAPEVEMGDDVPAASAARTTNETAAMAQGLPVEGAQGKKRVPESSPKKGGDGPTETEGARKKKKKKQASQG